MIQGAIVLISLLFVAVTVNAAGPDTPETTVGSFYRTYADLHFSGLPDRSQMKVLSRYLSPRLVALIQRAQRAQKRFITTYPQEKPPLIEGDLFSSLFEGPTQFEIVRTGTDSGTTWVRIKFTFIDSRPNQPSTTWEDRVLLTKQNSRWAIDDVEYLGGWDFAPKGRLSDALQATGSNR